MQYSGIYRCYSRDNELLVTTTSVQVFLHLPGVTCKLQQHNQITTFTLNYYSTESRTWGLFHQLWLHPLYLMQASNIFLKYFFPNNKLVFPEAMNFNNLKYLKEKLRPYIHLAFTAVTFCKTLNTVTPTIHFPPLQFTLNMMKRSLNVNFVKRTHSYTGNYIYYKPELLKKSWVTNRVTGTKLLST